jgi:hypothetical protein
MVKIKRVLIACEESQEVCKAFRELGFEAFSCDILPCSGGHPEWHIQDDVLKILEPHMPSSEGWEETNGSIWFNTSDGFNNPKIIDKWDLMIAHPPCTYLANSGSLHLFKGKKLNQERYEKGLEGKEFFMKLLNANIPRICVENPIQATIFQIPKYNQIIQPYQFGHEASKSTCLWLKGLPNLIPTKIVGKGEFHEWIGKNGKKKRQSKWYFEALLKAKTPEERRTLRSKTFPGIAKAMAEQWGKELIEDTQLKQEGKH